MGFIKHLFINHIDNIICDRNWSRRELAIKAGLHPSYFAALKTGSKKISSSTCHKIAHALDIPVETVNRWAGLLDSCEGDNLLLRELTEAANLLNDDDISMLIDLARVINIHRHETATSE